MKKVAKKEISHDETTIGGACMSGKFMTKKEEQETAVFIEKYKADKIAKQPKRVLTK
ncbi:hypothetical protein [Ferruginibacter sp. SUN106]|uniref:hypothetical protein n=1 Tax=Ferruginibacter sp. SUN106 TaxID=2978348 RepID=UPI003D361279